MSFYLSVQIKSHQMCVAGMSLTRPEGQVRFGSRFRSGQLGSSLPPASMIHILDCSDIDCRSNDALHKTHGDGAWHWPHGVHYIYRRPAVVIGNSVEALPMSTYPCLVNPILMLLKKRPEGAGTILYCLL